MKKSILAALVLILMVGCKESKSEANEPQENATEQSTEVQSADLAFVNVEMVMAESQIYKTEGIALREKTEKTQQSWARKDKALQNDLLKLQEKYQKGLITTIAAQQEEQKLQQKAQTYQQQAEKEIKQLEEENIVFNNRMADLMNRAIQQINADKRYKMIVNASALLDADLSLDISQQVLTVVNELYAKEKADK